MIIRAHARRNHKLQTERRGPMKVKKANSSLMFVVEDLAYGQLTTVHELKIILSLAKKGNGCTLEQLQEQATHYDATYHLGHKITGARKRKGGYDLKIKWMRLHNEKNVSWEPVNNIRDILAVVLEDALHTAGNHKIKREILEFNFQLNIYLQTCSRAL